MDEGAHEVWLMTSGDIQWVTFLDQVRDIRNAESAHLALTTLADYQLRAGDNQMRKNLTAIRKTIVDAIEGRLLPARDYDRRLDELQAGWVELCELFRGHLPAEVWEAIGAKVEASFSKERMREG
jgi:TolB-like protein